MSQRYHLSLENAPGIAQMVRIGLKKDGRSAVGLSGLPEAGDLTPSRLGARLIG